MHYTVLVVGDNVDHQMNKFSHDEPEYQQFVPYTQEDFDTFLKSKSYEKAQKEVNEQYAQYVKEQKEQNLTPTSLLNFWAEYWYGAEKYPGSEYYGHVKNPHAKYDWYEVGGRWSGFFSLKVNATGLKGGQYFEGNLKTVSGNADIVQLKDWDIEKLRETNKQEASILYQKAHTVINGRVVPLWPKFDFSNMDNYEKQSKQADEFHKNEVIVELKQNNFAIDDIIYVDFNLSAEEFIKEASLKAGTTYALLIDGVWYDKNSTENYEKLFWDKLNELSPETTLTIVDYHN